MFQQTANLCQQSAPFFLRLLSLLFFDTPIWFLSWVLVIPLQQHNFHCFRSLSLFFHSASMASGVRASLNIFSCAVLVFASVCLTMLCKLSFHVSVNFTIICLSFVLSLLHIYQYFSPHSQLVFQLCCHCPCNCSLLFPPQSGLTIATLVPMFQSCSITDSSSSSSKLAYDSSHIKTKQLSSSLFPPGGLAQHSISSSHLC